MMVGICRIAKFGWLSESNNVKVCDNAANYSRVDRL